MDIAIGILIGSVLGAGFIGFGFWLGFSFLKRQLPELPKPEVKVENHNHIEVPQRAVLRDQKPIEQQQDSTAEFIGDL